MRRDASKIRGLHFDIAPMKVGKIAEQLREPKKPTPLQLALERLGKSIGIAAFTVLILIFIFAVAVDYWAGSGRSYGKEPQNDPHRIFVFLSLPY